MITRSLRIWSGRILLRSATDSLRGEARWTSLYHRLIRMISRSSDVSSKRKLETASLHILSGFDTSFAANDTFSKLPAEMLELILSYLPSPDVVRPRQASRSFARIPLLDWFWKSRFLPGRELEFIYESGDSTSSHHGRWRTLYASVKDDYLDRPSLVNRRRIWHLASAIKYLLYQTTGVSRDGIPSRSFLEPNLASDDVPWINAGRAGMALAESFIVGSRALFGRISAVPNDMAALFVSTIDIFDRQYITGIRILRSCGDSLVLGYRHSRS